VLVERLRGRWWSHTIRVLAPLGALLVDGWPGLIGALLIQEGGLRIAGRLAEPCQRSFASRLFVAAYGLRVAIALVSHVVKRAVNGNGAQFPDDYTNDLVGEWLVRIARGDGTVAIFPGHQHLLEGLYPYLLMAIYAVFDYTPVLPKLLNAGLAALSAVLIFEITRLTFRLPAAILAAIGAVMLPTLVIWSIVSLKESLVFFVALLGLRTIHSLMTAPRRDGKFMDALVLLLGVLTLLFDLRTTTALSLVLLLAMVLVARTHIRARPWQLGMAGLGLVVVLGSALWFGRVRTSTRPFTSLAEDVVLQVRHRRAQEASGARSQLRPETEVYAATGREVPAAEAASDAAPFTIVGDVLDPLGYALLAPAPWQARTLPELAASAEMPIWYVLLAASLVAWPAAPQQRTFVLCLVAYGVANWLVLAATEGNLGNLLRHRLMLDPVLLILGAGGVQWLWERAGDRPRHAFRRISRQSFSDS
jgi:hypothetical protein